jgi:hypothetical protein
VSGEWSGLLVARDDRSDFPAMLKRDYRAVDVPADAAKGCSYPDAFKPSNDRFVDAHRLFSDEPWIDLHCKHHLVPGSSWSETKLAQRCGRYSSTLELPPHMKVRMHIKVGPYLQSRPSLFAAQPGREDAVLNI